MGENQDADKQKPCVLPGFVLMPKKYLRVSKKWGKFWKS
jgi:hypothetical protein